MENSDFNLNQNVINAVNKHFEDNKKSIIPFLMSSLNLHKESAYRRIGSQVPFTADEIAQLAKLLSFSIDKLAGIVSVPSNATLSSERLLETFNLQVLSTLKEDLHLVKKVINAEHVSIRILNNLMFKYFQVDTLFKYKYFLSLNQYNHSFSTPFSEIVVPEEIKEAHHELAEIYPKMRNIQYVITPNLYEYTISNISYYHSLGIFSDEDLAQMQKELHFMWQLARESMMTGKDNKTFYYTPLHTHQNLFLYEINDEKILSFWAFDELPMVIKNNNFLYQRTKSKFDQIVQNATLITVSSSMIRNQVLSEYEKQINNMSKQ